MCQVASCSHFSFFFPSLFLSTYAIYRASSIQPFPTYTSIPASSHPPVPPFPSPYPSHLYRLNSLFRSWSEKSPRPSRFRLRHSLGLLLRPLGAAEGGSREAHGHLSSCCRLVRSTVLAQQHIVEPFPIGPRHSQWRLERQEKKKKIDKKKKKACDNWDPRIGQSDSECMFIDFMIIA